MPRVREAAFPSRTRGKPDFTYDGRARQADHREPKNRGTGMNEQAIKDIVEGIIKGVLREQQNEGDSRNAELGQGTPGGAECGLHGGLSPKETLSAASCSSQSGADGPIPVEISARHVHLSERDAQTLFGGSLTPDRGLSQPGQFLSKERVRLIGPRGVIDNVAVLGPSRGSSQAEISKTDARILGVDVPVRQSGDASGTPGIILASQTGIVGLEEGLIVASRHIHMAPDDAAKFRVGDKDLVCVRLDGDRPIIFEDVLVRVDPSFKLAMHIDADEGNGSGWRAGVSGRIVGKKA